MPTYEFPTDDNSKEYAVSAFTGVDFSSDLSNVEPYRSPDSLNMTFSKFGAPVKRGGVKKIAQCPINGNINGLYTLYLEGNDAHFCHCGDKIYAWDYYAPGARVFDFDDIDYADFTFNTDPTLPYLREDMTVVKDGVEDTLSMAWQVGEYLWFIDGKNFLRIDKTGVVQRVADVAYTPTVGFGASPDGSDRRTGEDFNMLSAWAIDEFVGDGTTKVFNVTYPRVYAATAEVRSTTSPYDWVATSVASIDTSAGTVTLTTAPGKPLASGEDNVRITYQYTEDIEDSVAKIEGSSLGIMWNIYNGHTLVLSGNSAYRHYDWASAAEDPSYFPDSQESIIGSEESAVIGYCLFNGKLLVFKSDDYENATTYIRDAIVNDDYTFTFTTKEAVVNLSAISQRTIVDFMGDAVFLSHKGIFNVSESAVTSSRYANARSSFINRKLLKQQLRDAHMMVAGTRLYLFVGKSVYVSDKYSVSKSEISSHEFEWLYWELFTTMRMSTTIDGILTMGDAEGQIFQYMDGTSQDDYTDYGFRTIRAYWTTSYIFLDTYSRYKSIKRLFVMMVPYMRTSLDAYVKQQGGWTKAGHYDVRLMTFFDIDFNNFTFNTDSDSYVVKIRTRLRRLVLAQFRFENNMPNQPFGLLGYRCIYTVNGYAR